MNAGNGINVGMDMQDFGCALLMRALYYPGLF